MYKLMNDAITGEARAVFKANENKCIPFDPDNTDYQQYLKWLEEGNQVLPAEEQQ